MNKLRQEIKNNKTKFDSSEKDIKRIDTKIQSLIEEIKRLKESKDSLIKQSKDIGNSPYLILFIVVYSVFTDNKEDRFSDYHDYFFYDYSKDSVITKRVHHKTTLKINYPYFQINDHLIIDNKLTIQELNDINYLSSLIKRTIDSLMETYNPNSWEELHRILKESIINGTFMSIFYENHKAAKLKKISKRINS